MNNILEYKGFRAAIEFSADDDVFVGRLIDIDDIVSFHATTVEDLKTVFRESVDFHVEVTKKFASEHKLSIHG